MQYPPNNTTAHPQPHDRPAGPLTAPPTQEYAPPLLPPAGPSWALPAALGHWGWMPNAPQPPAPLAWQPGPAVVAGSPAWFIAPLGHLGWFSVPHLYGPIYSLGWVPPSPPAVKTPWRPPAAPRFSHPEGPDRDDDWEAPDDEPNEPEDEFELEANTVGHWLARVGKWCEKEPTITEALQFESHLYVTREFLIYFLWPFWLQTDPLLAHARLYYPDFTPSKDDNMLPDDFPERLEKSQKNLLCWLMLDFCAVDPGDDVVIAAGLEKARELGCLRYFEKLVVGELHLNPTRVRELKSYTTEMLIDLYRADFLQTLKLKDHV